MQNISRIYALSKRNVILRYKNSLVGFLWGFIKPLLYLLIFMVMFSQGSVPNFVLFVMSGLILWFFFSNATSQAVGSIVGSAGLIKALNIPSYFFPLSEVLSELFNLVLTLFVFLILMHWFGIVYSARLLFIVPLIILFATFAYGLNLILCSINVFFRDVGIIWGTIQPALFFLSPIGYPEGMIAEKYKLVIKCNPIYYYIKVGRTILYDSFAPSMHAWNVCIVIALITLAVGLFVYSRLKNQFISAI